MTSGRSARRSCDGRSVKATTRVREVPVAHDDWRASLRINHDNPTALAATLAELPADGLQHAGNAILGHLTDPALQKIAAEVIAALTDRDWHGDSELADALRRRLDNTPSSLTPIPVDLEELGEALDESPGVESLLHLDTGTVWPGGLLDLGEQPDGYDPEDPGRWLPFAGEGSRAGYRDMECFTATITDSAAAGALEKALVGKGAFARFRSTLDRYPEQLTAWHRFSDDARLSRARAWLADQGYEPTPR